MSKRILVLVVLVLSILSSRAQNKYAKISGVINTSDGRPAPGVSVTIKDSRKGAVSQADGSFEIRRVMPGEHVVSISLVGYETQSSTVSLNSGENKSITVQLKLSAAELNEVIVRGTYNKYKADNVSPALRQPSPILLVPQNIQVVTSDLLRDQQLFDMAEGVTRNVSGTTYSAEESWGNYSNIMMRGAAATPLRNGMNFDMPWGPIVEDLSMVERIEFVKGPAGFMFANAEPTGLYNVVTKKPTGIRKGEVAFTMGSFDTYRTTLDLDGKLSGDSRFLYRLNAMAQSKNSHRDYEFNNRVSIAPVISYKVNEKTTLTAEYTYQQMKMAMLGSAYVFSPKMGDLPANTSVLEQNLDPTNIREHNVNLSIVHQLSTRWNFTTQVGYLDYLQEGASIWPSYPQGLLTNGDLVRSIANWDAAGQARIGQMFVNGDFKTGIVNHRILAAVDLSYKNYYADFYQFYDLPGYDVGGTTIPFNVYNPMHAPIPVDQLPKFDRTLPLRQRGGGVIGESSRSMYLQDELSFAQDRIRLTLAGRYTTIRQQSFNEYSNDHAFTPRAGINISVTPSLSVYGLYDKSFVAQQGMDSLSKPFVPLTGTNLEAGVKKDWFNGRWSSTLSVYRITRNNVISFVPGPELKILQTGQTRTKGIEFDARGELFKSFNAVLNYSYNTAEVTKDEDPSRVGGPVDGPGFPKHITNGWFTYQLPLEKKSGVGVSLGYQFMAGRPHDLPDYFRMDAGVQWQNEHVGLSLNANNILDRHLFNGAPYEYNNDFTSTEYYFMTEAGINFRLSASYRW